MELHLLQMMLSSTFLTTADVEQLEPDSVEFDTLYISSSDISKSISDVDDDGSGTLGY